MKTAEFSLGVVLLGAGRSRRMGRPKLLLPWGTTSVLGHLLNQWQRLGAEQIALVCAVDNQAIHAELDRLGFPAADRIFNPAPERGMFSSIQCAARWPGRRPALTHWAISLGDQPHLRQATLQAVCDFAACHPAQVCQPSRAGRPRHPVFLPRHIFEQLATSTAPDLKRFLSAQSVAVCELDDPGMDLDLDEPKDYQKALRLARPGG